MGARTSNLKPIILSMIMTKKVREIKDLNKLVLDKDHVVNNCQDQIGHLLEKDYNNIRVSLFRNR